MRGVGLGLLCAAALGGLGCRKAAAVDPAEAAYHHAVVRFAELSQLTQDLTYRDPRFDSVLEELDRIPSGTGPKPRALALAERIRQARALAEARQRRSAQLQAQAEIAPAFQPQLEVRAPVPPLPVREVAPPTLPPISGEESSAASTASPTPTAARRLPSWYAGYFGQPAADQDGGSQGDGSEVADASVQVAAPAAVAPSSARAKSAPADTDAPPPVFGLPGPARGAIQGRPSSE